MGNVGFRIISDFKRPEKALIEAFRELPVANIDDCMNRTAAVDGAIRPLTRTPLLGTAFTVQVPEGDNLMFHKAMDLAQPGDVIVIDAGGDTNRAIFGGLMISYCKVRSLAGVIVDGAIRDYRELADMDFPVYAKGVTPNGPYKNGPGTIGETISFGGKVVRPGDIIVGDEDGIIIVKPEEAEELAKAAQGVVAKEAAILDNILNNHSYDRPWVDEQLRKTGCTF